MAAGDVGSRSAFFRGQAAFQGMGFEWMECRSGFQRRIQRVSKGFIAGEDASADGFDISFAGRNAFALLDVSPEGVSLETHSGP